MAGELSLMEIIIAARAEGMAAFKEAEGGVRGLGGAATTVGLALGVGLVGGLGASIKSAGDFQEKMTQIVTGAGEAQSNIDLVSKGILDMSSQVGQSAMALADGYYMVSSAGYHGAEGLKVLQAAAEGAKVGNADMAKTADALTSTLNAYHQPAANATAVTSELVATVASGKMHMQDLAASLGTVLLPAASLHVPFEQVAGAISTMTSKGTDAATATQSLRFLMASLSGPTSAAAKEMKGLGVGEAEIPGITAQVSAELKTLGLNTSEVADTLSKGGIQPAMAMITDAIGKKFPEGSAEYNAALKNATGGTRGLTAALALSGVGAETWAANVKSITAAGKEGATSVAGWSEVQGDFNFKLDKAKAAIGAASIEVGTKMLPAMSQLLTQVTPLLPKFAEFATQLGSALVPAISAVVNALGFVVQHGNTVVQVLRIVGPIVLGLVTAFKIYEITMWAMRTATAAYAIVMDAVKIATAAWTAAQWLLNIAMDANPIGLIILGIAALIVVIVLIVTHWGQFSSAVLKAWDVVKSVVGSGVSAVVGALTSFAGRIVSMAESLWSQFSSKPVYWITYVAVYIPIKLAELQGAIAVWLAKIIENAAIWAAQMIAHGINAATQFVVNVIQFVAQLPGKFNQWLISVIEQIPGWAGRLVSEGQAAANNFSQAIVTEVQKLPGQMLSIGAQIVQGIISGVQGMVGNLKGAISQAVSGALDAAKAAAGIHSPSTVFAAEVGVPISQGIAVGISRGQGLVQAALAGVASPTGATGLSLGYNVSGAVSGGQGGGGATASDARLDKTNSLLQQLVDAVIEPAAPVSISQNTVVQAIGQLMQQYQQQNRRGQRGMA